MSKEAMKSEMVDDDGENQAVRMFLAMYGGQAGITTKQMRKHLEMAGFDGAWPDWASNEMHLTKAGAQLWIRHLFALAEQPAQQEPVAWMCHPFGDEEVEYGPHQECENCIPLYTSPPAQRTWVSLTAQETASIAECVYGSAHHDDITFATEIQIKLKEKNQ